MKKKLDHYYGLATNARKFSQQDGSAYFSAPNKYTDPPILRVAANAPQQKNSVDCGLYVVLFVDHILSRWATFESKFWSEDFGLFWPATVPTDSLRCEARIMLISHILKWEESS